MSFPKELKERASEIASIIGDYCFSYREAEGIIRDSARGVSYQVGALRFGAGFKNAEIWAEWKGAPCFAYKCYKGHYFCARPDRYNSGEWESVLEGLKSVTADFKKKISAKRADEDRKRQAGIDERFAPMEVTA